jgi:hypothetical protein
LSKLIKLFGIKNLIIFLKFNSYNDICAEWAAKLDDAVWGNGLNIKVERRRLT